MFQLAGYLSFEFKLFAIELIVSTGASYLLQRNCTRNLSIFRKVYYAKSTFSMLSQDLKTILIISCSGGAW